MAIKPLTLREFLSRHALEGLSKQLYQEHTQQYSVGIKILAFVGAMIGACMFLLFLFLAELIRSEQSLFFSGLIFWGLSLAMSYVKSAKGLMYEPTLLVLGILGQMLMLAGENVFSYGKEFLGLYTLFLFVETITIIVSKNIVMRFLAATLLPCLLVGICWTLQIYESIHFFVGLTAWLLAYLWSEEGNILNKFAKHISYFYPLGFGLVIALLIILSTNIYKEFSEMYFKHWWLSSVLLWALLWQQVRYMLGRLQIVSTWHIPIYIAVIVLLSPTVFTPGVSLSLLIILLGFRAGNTWLTTLGVLAFLLFINAFYYNLNLSLLFKSITLMVAGAFFIALFFVIKKWKSS